MVKSGVMVGGAIGSIAVIAVFIFILIPTSLQPEIPSNDLIVSNGHGVSTVGETTPIYEGKNLSLIQIFEKSESGVVRVNVQRPEQIVGANSVGSGFVFDSKGHIIT
ncbi:MAG: trypsin, partial [Nitrosopumilaceae archaeon]